MRRKEVPRWCICRACLAGRGQAREPAVVSDRRPGRRSDRSSGKARHLQLIRHHLPDVLVGAAASPPRAVGWHAGADDEPDARGVLDMIVPQYVGYQLYQMVLESRASEHSARMVAMKAATDNAKQMIKDLTLDYNKQRQAAITSELLEITTAMRALE